MLNQPQSGDSPWGFDRTVWLAQGCFVLSWIATAGYRHAGSVPVVAVIAVFLFGMAVVHRRRIALPWTILACVLAASVPPLLAYLRR